jgi:hypothetical protein
MRFRLEAADLSKLEGLTRQYRCARARGETKL